MPRERGKRKEKFFQDEPKTKLIINQVRWDKGDEFDSGLPFCNTVTDSYPKWFEKCFFIFTLVMYCADKRLKSLVVLKKISPKGCGWVLFKFQNVGLAFKRTYSVVYVTWLQRCMSTCFISVEFSVLSSLLLLTPLLISSAPAVIQHYGLVFNNLLKLSTCK